MRVKTIWWKRAPSRDELDEVETFLRNNGAYCDIVLVVNGGSPHSALRIRWPS